MKDKHGERLHFDPCPKCGKAINGYPAVSRVDGAPICSDCGTREALESMGMCAAEQDRIIELIHTRYCDAPTGETAGSSTPNCVQ